MLDRADELALSLLCDARRMGRPLRQEATLVLAVLGDAVEMCTSPRLPPGGSVL
jgi:hypothetical protein